MHTEDEARKLWCPMARYAWDEDKRAYNRYGFIGNDDTAEDVLNPESCRCIASECAVWRWFTDQQYAEGPGGTFALERHGYCGLAGPWRAQND